MSGTIRATTKEEVDTAFVTFGGPDEIIVEGDNDLLQYAEERARVETQRADVEAHERLRPTPEDLTKAGGKTAFAFRGPMGAAVIVVIILAFAFERAGPASFLDKWGGTLIWAVVALAAIGGMYALATKAMNKGNDVVVQWKVTKAVMGKVTIKRVETPIRRKRKKK